MFQDPGKSEKSSSQIPQKIIDKYNVCTMSYKAINPCIKYNILLFMKAVLRNRNQNHSICFGRYLCWTLVGPRSLVSSSAVMTYQFIKVMGCEDEEMLHKDLVPSHRLLSAEPGKGRRRMLRTNQRGNECLVSVVVLCRVQWI